jgi:hypothetical protein
MHHPTIPTFGSSTQRISFGAERALPEVVRKGIGSRIPCDLCTTSRARRRARWRCTRSCVTLDEARIRLEGALELVEAGTQRYRSLSDQIDRVSLLQPEIAALAETEDELGTAALQVSALHARDAHAALQQALEDLGEARRTLRLQVRERLQALNVRRSGIELADELELLRNHAFMPLIEPPVARFPVGKPLPVWLSLVLMVLGVGPMLMLALLFAPSLLAMGIWSAVVTAATLSWRGTQYTSLDIHGDRIRLTRPFGSPRVVTLSRLKQLGPLEFVSDDQRMHAVALTELLDHPCFERAGPSTGAEVCGADEIGTHKRYAAIIGENHALIIDETPDALDAAVGHRARWTQPRAYHLALVLIRLPEEDRELVVKRLNVAGLARTVPRADFSRDFRTL